MKKLVEGGPSLAPTNQVGRSFAIAADPHTEREPKNKNLTLKMDGESHPNKTMNKIGTATTDRRHPFTNFVMEAPILNKWKDSIGIDMMGRLTSTSTWMRIPLI